MGVVDSSNGFDHNRLLAALSAEDREFVSPKLNLVPLKAGHVLVTAYEPIEHVYFPLAGVVTKVAQKEKGRIEVGLVGRDGFASPAVALGSSSSPHSSVVLVEGHAMRMSVTDFRAAFQDRTSFRQVICLYVHSLIAQMAQTIYGATVCTIDARLARVILMLQDRLDSDEIKLTHSALAGLLGTRRPSVTAATHFLEGDGMIRSKRNRILVLDREKLRAKAGAAYDVAEAEYERVIQRPLSS